MISKNYEKTHGDTFLEGGGRPFPMAERKPPLNTTPERNKKVEIDLEALNVEGKSPVNFIPKRGRTVGSFVDPQKEDRDVDEAFDID